MCARVLSFVSLSLLFGSVSLAAAQDASLAGAVVDGTKAALPGATITATMVDTGRASTTVSDVRGEYRLRGLAPGRYRVQPSCRASRPSSSPTSSCSSARTATCRLPCRWRPSPKR